VGVDENGGFVDALHLGVGDGTLLASGSLGGKKRGGEDKEGKDFHLLENTMREYPRT
jgi:hypothetical protein